MTDHDQPETDQPDHDPDTHHGDTDAGPETPAGGPHTPPAGEDTAAAVAALTAERDALAAQMLRLQVANDTGVPVQLLAGDDEDQLRAHAAALVAFAETRRRPDFGGGFRGDNTPPPDLDPLRSALGRRR